MKLLHIADLHFGKTLHQHSLIEDQAFFIEELLKIIRHENPDVLVIAGDIYDRTVPSGETVKLLDYFLTALSKEQLTTLIIAGNHDSADRLQFAASVFEQFNIYIVTEYKGKLDMISLFQNQYHFYLLPFFKKSQIKAIFPDENIESEEDAMRVILRDVDFDQSGKHILVSHQFFVNQSGEALTSDSEVISVGGTDQIRAGLVKDFDYVALGHLHQPHYVQYPHIRYAGSPLIYSASELIREKTITSVCFKDDEMVIDEIQYPQLYKTKIAKGYFAELIKEASDKPEDAYYYIELLDEHIIESVAARFRRFYPNILEIKMTNLENGYVNNEIAITEHPTSLTTDELFSLFYKAETGENISEEELNLLKSID